MNCELLSYINKDIHFEYSSYSTEEPNIILELYRGKLFCYIIREFINKAVNIFGIKIFNVKKTFQRTLTNLLSSWMFTLYASKNFNPKYDVFIPNNYNETQPLKNILFDLVKYDDGLENKENNINELILFLVNLYEKQLLLLDKYKVSIYNKNNYKINKKKIYQERDSIEYLFYKFEIKIGFVINDRKLINILSNLLIPYDEYIKLETNFTGDKTKLDELIWIILFRYQLLGSNNHQLGVKQNIMLNMNKDYDLNFECFASSINNTFNKYCSIYYDVERYFGSVGSFYNLNPIRGTYGLNPPYQIDIINTSIRRIFGFLEKSESNNNILTFIITIPIWDIEGKKMFSNDLPQQNIDYGDFNIIKEINNNKYHKISRMISKENFSYIDHNFKLLKNKTIQNTYVIILSSNDNIDTTKILAYDFL